MLQVSSLASFDTRYRSLSEESRSVLTCTDGTGSRNQIATRRGPSNCAHKALLRLLCVLALENVSRRLRVVITQLVCARVASSQRKSLAKQRKSQSKNCPRLFGLFLAPPTTSDVETVHPHLARDLSVHACARVTRLPLQRVCRKCPNQKPNALRWQQRRNSMKSQTSAREIREQSFGTQNVRKWCISPIDRSPSGSAFAEKKAWISCRHFH